MTEYSEPGAATGLRERKKAATRRTIRVAALELALEHGLENLTVEAISEAADISPRTFFNYFPSKEDALVTDAAGLGEALRPRILSHPSDESPLRVLRAVVTEDDPFALVHARRDRALARQRMVRDNTSLQARQWAQHYQLERTVADALAERFGVDPDEDLRPSLLAGITGSVFRAALRKWADGDTDSLRELLDSAFDLLEQDVLTDFSVPATHTSSTEVHP